MGLWTKKCENPECGKEFVTTNSLRKYCCKKCNRRAYKLGVKPARKNSGWGKSIRDPEAVFVPEKRKCSSCGKKTYDYRCPECWEKVRRKSDCSGLSDAEGINWG